EIYSTIERESSHGKDFALILPVGPVFQYRRLVELHRRRPLDFTHANFFFMDEYLDDPSTMISAADPLSFRGFIDRELIEPLGETLRSDQVKFPTPGETEKYDRRLEALGGARLCVAGVGINGHVAFNEPPEQDENITDEEFGRLPTRVVALTRETITINSNTALRGAYERVPKFAVTVGMRQILSSARIRIYLNRPWQSAVLRKLLFGSASLRFPVSLLRGHGDIEVMATEEVAQEPVVGLK
ncbi:MAG TPA: glucosamine-6-phosphate isomerase, partial [Spirochaetia bacterium]|nr:glucosamine-6-phosphate isomerase [Spirochaetia bacterium]